MSRARRRKPATQADGVELDVGIGFQGPDLWALKIVICALDSLLT